MLSAPAVVQRPCDDDQAQKIVFNRRALAPLLPAATTLDDDAQDADEGYG